MRFYKTHSTQRANYTYEFTNIECNSHVKREKITADMVGEEWIKMNHLSDDNEVTNNIKNSKHISGKREREQIRKWEEENQEKYSGKWVISIDACFEGSFDNSKLATQVKNFTGETRDNCKERLYEAVEKLTEEQQEIYRLYFQEEYTQAEIAEMKGVTQKTISLKINKIEKTLKEMCLKNL